MSQALTNALAAIDQESGDDPEAQLILATCRGLFYGYDAKWWPQGGTQPWETVSVEETFTCQIKNPKTGRQSRTFTQAGKLDGVVKHTNNQRYLLEHKTTSEDIEDPDAPFWRRLTIDSQVSSYTLAHWQRGEKLAGTLYDVIRKPGIRPKKLDQKAQAEIASLHTYLKAPVSPAVEAEALRIKRETPELFEIRLAVEVLENSNRYYQRKNVPRLDGELLEWADELWDSARDIADARRLGRHYRNSGACMNWNRPCEYLGICSGHDSPDSDNWRKREIHSELELDSEDPTKILTHSRIRCFQTCRRKHYYRYELGIERAREERDALYFGHVFHAGLAAWWSTFLPSQEPNHGNSTESTASASSTVAQPN